MLRLLAALVVLGVAGVLGLLLWPQSLGLEQTAGFAQVVSLRGAAAAAALLSALVLALLGAVIRPLRAFLGALALILLAFAAATVILLGARGFGGPAFQTKSDGDITVLAWNTLGEAVTASEVARLAVDSDADVVSLPETTAAFTEQVATEAAALGLDLTPHTFAFDEIAKARSTSLLIADRLGAYTVGEDAVTSTLPSLVATSDDGTGPTIVAVHAVAPVPGELRSWRADLGALAALCSTPDVILAGDFNATLDAFAGLGGTDADGTSTDLGGCTDAARAHGAAAVGTWPASVPALLGAPIDHVMTGSDWRVTGFRVVLDQDGAGSDHRPVLAQLSLAD